MDSYDVVVVGAGISGLRTAQLLKDEGLQVLVLEADNRIGGRIVSFPTRNLPHLRLDGGAQWLSVDHIRALKLCEQFELETYRQAKDYTRIALPRFSIHACRILGQDILSYNPWQLYKILAVIGHIDSAALLVPLDRPEAARSAAYLDRITLRPWLQAGRVSDDIIDFLYAAWKCVLTTSVDEISVLWLLFYVHSAGGLTQLFDSAQDIKLIGGMQGLVEKLAQGLEIKLSCRVEQLQQSENGVVVVHSGGRCHSRAVVVSVPALLAVGIAFTPSLPPNYAQVAAAMSGGNCLKFQLVYPRAFWGRTKQWLLDDVVEMVAEHYSGDNTHILVGFAHHQEGKSREQRKSAILEQMVKHLGPEANGYLEYYDTLWDRTNRPFTYGCVNPWRTGTLSETGMIHRTSHGNIHFCGAETAFFWNGYVDGALESAHRAALAVVNGMNREISSEALSQPLLWLQPRRHRQLAQRRPASIISAAVMLVLLLLVWHWNRPA